MYKSKDTEDSDLEDELDHFNFENLEIVSESNLEYGC